MEIIPSDVSSEPEQGIQIIIGEQMDLADYEASLLPKEELTTSSEPVSSAPAIEPVPEPAPLPVIPEVPQVTYEQLVSLSEPINQRLDTLINRADLIYTCILLGFGIAIALWVVYIFKSIFDACLTE